MRSLSRSAVAGAVCEVVDAYRVSAGGETEGNAARWRWKKMGLVLAAYVKRLGRAGLVRAEVACARRATSATTSRARTRR